MLLSKENFSRMKMMDTVEELNGTYFYNGVANISAGELFSGFF